MFWEIGDENGWVNFLNFGIRMDFVESRFEIKSAHMKKVCMSNHVLTSEFLFYPIFFTKWIAYTGRTCDFLRLPQPVYVLAGT